MVEVFKVVEDILHVLVTIGVAAIVRYLEKKSVISHFRIRVEELMKVIQELREK